MELKVLEIRDRATYIAVIAVQMKSDDLVRRFHLRRAGFSPDVPLIKVIRLDSNDCSYDPYKWDVNSRTMFEAHQYIVQNWNDIKDGDVIDVEFILGESTSPKVSERFNDWRYC